MADVQTLNAPADPKNDRREIFGWTMYDWANSAFTTTVVAALFGPYLTAITQAAIGENGVVLNLGFYSITAKSLYSDAVSLSVLLQFFFLPLLGALADYTNLKKQLLGLFCGMGAVATGGLFFVTESVYWLGGLLFLIANLSFGASIVFYNAFLNDITTEDNRDKISSRGFALGYIGGGVLLALNLALVTFAGMVANCKPDSLEACSLSPSLVSLGEQLGLTVGMAVRISLASAGLWWGFFGWFALNRLRRREAARTKPAGVSYLRVSLSELGGALREMRRLPQTLRFLVGYLLYNDGIQTVIGVSAVFLSQELFSAQERLDGKDQSFLLTLVLMIQFMAFFGALGFERIARRVGTKNAIIISLAIWTGVIVYAYAFLSTLPQAYVMGAAIAIVLGGSQALSRSLFSKMIPHGREAAFFGIYEVSERGTSWIGPFIFARVVASTGSYRQAILSLIVLFVAGTGILFFTDTTRAIHDAGNRLPEEINPELAA
jgi:UMF1 family MFS transporter